MIIPLGMISDADAFKADPQIGLNYIQNPDYVYGQNVNVSSYLIQDLDSSILVMEVRDSSDTLVYKRTIDILQTGNTLNHDIVVGTSSGDGVDANHIWREDKYTVSVWSQSMPSVGGTSICVY